MVHFNVIFIFFIKQSLKFFHGWSCLNLSLCISYIWTLSYLGNNVIIFMPFLTFFIVYTICFFFKYDSKSHQMLLQATSLTLSTVLTIFSSLHMHIPIEYLWTLTLLTSKTLNPHPQVCDLSPFLFPGVQALPFNHWLFYYNFC